ncbi:MAG TPA: tetratricopeptide repeat protein [Candidatus Saccharimonadales bacterium]|jgi:tetratricopeptide (TPR) repeat protein|nr:tetratricopeptide repeat protein [Candidatus Saccharimonadales bacterium]
MKASIVLAAVLFPAVAFGQPQQSEVGQAEVSIPGVKGLLQLNVGRSKWETQVRPDGKETQLRAMGRADGVLISAFLQRVDFPASAERCRAEWWTATEKVLEKNGLEPKGVHLTEREGMAVVDYFRPEVQGKPIRQQSVFVYLGSRDLCAEIHMSKVRFEKEEQKLFEEVIATAKLLPDEQAADQGRSRVELGGMALASRSYLQRDYVTAARVYQVILDFEKQRHVLNRTEFRVLVDNLGMSYGNSGNLSNAKKTFEYGITQDAEYPLFYYNLACTYSAMGKMEEALEQLRLAYKYKANMIVGEKFPDPLTDDSFRNFAENREFVDAVRSMQRP